MIAVADSVTCGACAPPITIANAHSITRSACFNPSSVPSALSPHGVLPRAGSDRRSPHSRGATRRPDGQTASRSRQARGKAADAEAAEAAAAVARTRPRREKKKRKKKEEVSAVARESAHVARIEQPLKIDDDDLFERERGNP